MRILYYCPEYFSLHGGRAHARGFFGALKNVSSVSESFLYPSNNSGEQHSKGKVSPDKLKLLPRTVRQLIYLFWPRRNLTNILIREIRNHECDALIIRTGLCNLLIGMIKRACPDTVTCLEINAAACDESFRGVPFRSVLQRLEVMMFNRADAITVVSSYLKNYLVKRGVPSRKIIVNHNGVNVDAVTYSGLDNIRKKYGIPDGAFLLGYIGGMETFRRLPEVIRYMAELRSAGNYDLYLLIVGDGKDMGNVQAAIEAERSVLGNSVKCLGWQEHSEVPKFLSAFDISIFPFTNDYCSPLKLFEYMGAGVPTIGPDTAAVREVFEDGVHLKLVKQDGSNFISTVMDLKDNPQLRAELGDNGRQLVLSEYTWEKNVERVLTHIQRIRSQ